MNIHTTSVRARLRPCRVPWAISPTDGAVTLTHTETDTGPECKVVLGGGRLQSNDRTDMRVIELSFAGCFYAIASPKRDDRELTVEGFELLEGGPQAQGWLEWWMTQWRANGYCPRSGLWVAVDSRWLSELSIEKARHYVVGGRDGYVELIATSFSWREWLWESGLRRDEVQHHQPVVHSGIASQEDAAQRPERGKMT